MLIGIFTIFSLAVAAGLCLLTGSFAGLGWLWVLPVTAVGMFVLLAGIWFVVLVVMANAADMENKQEEDNKFYRWVLHNTIDAILPLLGVRFHTKGFEQKLPEGRFLLVSNHLHDIDPAMLLHCFPKSQLAFISKKENDGLFAIGPLMHKTLCQSIDRDDDRQALQVILKCIRILKEDKASIAVFPEGGTNHDDKLHPFRPGVFKIAQKANVPIVVCTMKNTKDAIPNMLHLRKTDIEVSLLDVIYPESYADLGTTEMAQQIYELMAADLGPDLVAEE